jgi:ABC-type amino acid transport substrate-binding protein
MILRKVIPFLILAVVLVCSLTACGQSAAKTITTTAAPSPSEVSPVLLDAEGYHKLLNGKAMGFIYQNYNEDLMQQGSVDAFKKAMNIDINIKVVYVDSLSDGLLMLRSGKIAALQLMRFTGRYLAQRNADLTMYFNDGFLVFSTHMIFSPEKQTQLDRVNAAIKAMKEDGTLAKLTGQWITDLPVGQEPSSGSLPVIAGAETLKVGISGDAPPLDYIAADGAPGGFNVAVLSEIGRRANLNVELVTVNSGARFTALQSGKIDSFLWHTPYHNSAESALNSAPSTQTAGSKNFIKSDAYLDSRACILTLK